MSKMETTIGPRKFNKDVFIKVLLTVLAAIIIGGIIALFILAIEVNQSRAPRKIKIKQCSNTSGECISAVLTPQTSVEKEYVELYLRLERMKPGESITYRGTDENGLLETVSFVLGDPISVSIVK